MIIYGSRMYGRKNVVKGWGACDHCGVYGKHVSYNGRKWGHLYFIPLIPIGPKVRVIKECGKCSHGLHLPETEVPSFLDGVKENTKQALATLIAGEKEFESDGEQVSCVACLAGSVEMLYCLQAEDHLRLIQAALQEKGLSYAMHMVGGEAEVFQGRQDSAAASYKKAAEIEPSDPIPLMYLGAVHLNKKDHEGAKVIYEKALGVTDDRFSVLSVLLPIYEKLKDHTKLAETYEQCFELMPELTEDKKTLKAYKKACKKAGKEPIPIKSNRG